MTDLQNFVAMMSKGCHNYSIDDFCGVTRVQVKTHKFNNWLGLITAKQTGVPLTMVYVFDKYGGFLSTAVI